MTGRQFSRHIAQITRALACLLTTQKHSQLVVITDTTRLRKIACAANILRDHHEDSCNMSASGVDVMVTGKLTSTREHDMTILTEKTCAPCKGGTQPLRGNQVADLMAQLGKHWENVNDDKIAGTFKFKNYYRTQAFVNAVAYIAHREDHHPDITFGYNQCRIELTTHAIDGLSENDFISAAKIDLLLG